MRKSWLFAGVLGLVAALVYSCSVAGYAFPGESAHLLAVWRGLVSDPGLGHPLMAVFVKALGAGNLLAPICGVVSVVAFFHLVVAFMSWRTGDKEADEPEETWAALFAATAATVVFMLSPAVRSGATHLEARMFDFTWVLLSFSTVFLFLRSSKPAAYIFPVLLGAMIAFGFCDSAIFLTLLPLFLALVVAVALLHEQRVYLPLLLFVVSVIVSLFAAGAVLGVGVLDVLKSASRELPGFWSAPGWLFVALFSILPFAVSLVSSGKVFAERPGIVQVLFHVAMTFVAILATATPLSPSSLMEPYGTLPVASCAFVAFVSGYLVAYWWTARHHLVPLVSGCVLVFVLLVSSVWNLFSFDGDAGEFADQVAGRILADLGGRRWIVTDGTLDDHLALVAAKAGEDVHLISLARDLDEAYLDELAELVGREGVGGSKNESLRLSLKLGVLPFVQDWFSSDPSAQDDVAIFGAPDLWYSAGVAPVPEVLFFGANRKIEPDWSAWKDLDAILHAPEGWGSYRGRAALNPVDRMRLGLRRHLGFVANNRGVYLQDQGRDNEAFQMYELVLNEIDPDNICAIFNEVAMVGQGHFMAVAKKSDLEAMLKAAVEDKGRRYLLWRLATYYGYIRNPDTFIRMGFTWARTGRPGVALSQIRRAIDFLPTEKRHSLLGMMAALYANEYEQSKSRRIYQALLKKNAKDHDALIGMMRLELQSGNGKEALQYLERAAESHADGGKGASVEQAMVLMMKGDLAAAKDILRHAVDLDPKDLQPWSLLAAVTMQQIDATADEKTKTDLTKELENEILPAMEKNSTGRVNYYLQSTRGFLLLRKGEAARKEARDAFATAARARPDVSSTQDIVLGLDISLDDKENAAVHARDILRRNRKAPLANYIMGSLALEKGEYVNAEAYLRVAAEAPQPVVLALNDLAEVMRRQKRLDEAERYARKATERAPKLYIVWETLGAVLMDTEGDLDEAEACIRKACELSKGANGRETDVRMLVSLARVQMRRKDFLRAKVTVRKIRSRIGELSDFERREFEDVARGVK